LRASWGKGRGIREEKRARADTGVSPLPLVVEMTGFWRFLESSFPAGMKSEEATAMQR
jgi:hypothetical protein